MEMEAIRVLSWAEFMASPTRLHRVFSKTNGKLTFDRQVIFDLTSSCTVDKAGIGFRMQKDEIILFVHTLDELSHLMEELLRKHLLMRITVIHAEIVTQFSVETISIIEDDFAVLINTGHPSLKTQLGESLKRAALRMTRCRKFCLEVDITEVMRNWYAEHRGAITSCDDIHQMKLRRTRLFVTNHSIYNHCFDCRPKWLAFLCLCWLMTAPCYFTYRKLTCSDLYIELQGEITNASALQEETSRVSTQQPQRRYQTV